MTLLNSEEPGGQQVLGLGEVTVSPPSWGAVQAVSPAILISQGSGGAGENPDCAPAVCQPLPKAPPALSGAPALLKC